MEEKTFGKIRRLPCSGYRCMAIFFLLVFFPFRSYCQADYEEIILTLNGKSIGSAEIPALIYEEKAYLPVHDLFDFLHIKNSLSEGADSLSGFFMHPGDGYSISKKRNTISYNGSIYQLAQYGLFFLNDEYYLRSDYFGKVFGLECVFNFRGLAISFSTAKELPFVREQRREEMRRNISKLKGERRADTVIGRDFSLFRPGAIDWDASSSHFKGKTNALLRLGFGSLLAGGEANVMFNYNSLQPFDIKRQYYIWRYVDNDRIVFNQLSVGRVSPSSSVSLYGSLNGFQINNSPSSRRKSFGTYLVSNTTNPNWIVELYINDVLVNYTKADAAGFFSFEVPMVYGGNSIKYKYYGPWGEEKTSEERINIPFTFLPPGRFEYGLTAGFIDDEANGKFSKLNLNYGLNRRVTLGTGVEYNSSLTQNKAMPFLTASLRLGNAMIFSGQHTKDVVTRADFNYRLRAKLQVDFAYAKFAKNQTVVRTGSVEEKKLTLSLPVRSRFFNGFSKLQVNSIVLYKGRQENAELFLGGNFAGLNATISTFAILPDLASVFSRVSVILSLPWNIKFTPQVQYDYKQRNFSMLRAMAEKQFSKKSMMSLGYEKNNLLGTGGVTLAVKHNFSFAQTSAVATQVNRSFLITQNASGGLVFDKRSRKLLAKPQKNIGRGGFMLVPFLDLNFNGKRDKNEPGVKGLVARVDGGQVEQGPGKTTVKVLGLEPYNKYFVVLDENSFENPAWKIRNKVMGITAQPNVFSSIEIPVLVVGEVAGYIYIKADSLKQGAARVKLNIYNQDGILAAKTLSEEDGYFSYLGLMPGNYYVVADEEQLKKIKMTAAGS